MEAVMREFKFVIESNLMKPFVEKIIHYLGSGKTPEILLVHKNAINSGISEADSFTLFKGEFEFNSMQLFLSG